MGAGAGDLRVILELRPLDLSCFPALRSSIEAKPQS